MNIYYGGQIFPNIRYKTKENDFITMVNKSDEFGQKYLDYALQD